MSMLAEKKQKSKLRLLVNPKESIWSSEENKFGQKLLEKMGWTKGKGLGKGKQGIIEPVKTIFKDDTKGMGYKATSEKEWIKNVDAFEGILTNLSSITNPEALSNENISSNESEFVESLEQRSKSSKNRVHYKKFTRGKDLSLYKEEELASILGSKKSSRGKSESKEEVDTKVNPDNIGEVNKTHGLTTIHGGNLKEYFNYKMSELKKKRNEGLLGECNNDNNPSCNSEQSHNIAWDSSIPDLNFEPSKTEFSFNVTEQEPEIFGEKNEEKIESSPVSKIKKKKDKKKKREYEFAEAINSIKSKNDDNDYLGNTSIEVEKNISEQTEKVKKEKRKKRKHSHEYEESVENKNNLEKEIIDLKLLEEIGNTKEQFENFKKEKKNKNKRTDESEENRDNITEEKLKKEQKKNKKRTVEYMEIQDNREKENYTEQCEKLKKEKKKKNKRRDNEQEEFQNKELFEDEVNLKKEKKKKSKNYYYEHDEIKENTNNLEKEIKENKLLEDENLRKGKKKKSKKHEGVKENKNYLKKENYENKMLEIEIEQKSKKSELNDGNNDGDLNHSYAVANLHEEKRKSNKKRNFESDDEKDSFSQRPLKKMQSLTSEMNLGNIFKDKIPNSSKEGSDLNLDNKLPKMENDTETPKLRRKLTSKLSFMEVKTELGNKIKNKIQKTTKSVLPVVAETDEAKKISQEFFPGSNISEIMGYDF